VKPHREPDLGEDPLVRVVVVSRNGGAVLVECVRALAATDWPPDRLEIVIVDNASSDGSVEAAAAALPSIRLLRLERNLGFAGGNNAALRDLGAVDYVALVNNDAFVEPGWLRPLVQRLEEDPGLGAACPKILLEGSFAEVELESPVHVRGRIDPRPLGIKVLGARLGGRDASESVYFAGGFHGPEDQSGGRFQWSNSRARLLVRVPEGNAELELELASDRQKDVVARCGGRELKVTVGTVPGWHAVPVAPLGVAIVNSVGALMSPKGYGADRGFLEPDRGQYDEPAEVATWSGAAVLLRRSYLNDVGLFDEHLFLYYEDFDLAWRGRARGWRYGTAPSSVVRHAHASSAGLGSGLFDYLNERNRLLVFTKNASGALARAAVTDSLYATALHVKRDILARALAGERPELTLVGRRLRATAGYAVALPHALTERRRLLRGGAADDVDTV
jgi:GT2 family glycosyltransferase